MRRRARAGGRESARRSGGRRARVQPTPGAAPFTPPVRSRRPSRPSNKLAWKRPHTTRTALVPQRNPCASPYQRKNSRARALVALVVVPLSPLLTRARALLGATAMAFPEPDDVSHGPLHAPALALFLIASNARASRQRHHTGVGERGGRRAARRHCCSPPCFFFSPAPPPPLLTTTTTTTQDDLPVSSGPPPPALTPSSAEASAAATAAAANAAKARAAANAALAAAQAAAAAPAPPPAPPQDAVWHTGVAVSMWQNSGDPMLSNWSQFVARKFPFGWLPVGLNRYQGPCSVHECNPGSWERYKEDVALAKRLGCNAYRLSIEWARVEPRRGEIDQAAVDR